MVQSDNRGLQYSRVVVKNTREIVHCRCFRGCRSAEGRSLCLVEAVIGLHAFDLQDQEAPAMFSSQLEFGDLIWLSG